MTSFYSPCACRREPPLKLEPMRCPKCRIGTMMLKRTVGWFCTKCESGPYIQQSSGLVLRNCGRHEPKRRKEK